MEVIHLGHNRAAHEVVQAAIEEDAHAICLSSYQGGHVEYFSYVKELLDQHNAPNIRIFGGGGGVITPPEIKLLESRGITKIYSPEDGAKLGLDGIIDDIVQKSQHSTTEGVQFSEMKPEKLGIVERFHKSFLISKIKVSHLLIFQKMKFPFLESLALVGPENLH